MPMSLDLAAAIDPALISLFKPIIFLIVLGAWAWVASTLDKDMEFFYLQRFTWNVGIIAAAIVGFGLWLLLPMFWIGLPLCVMIVCGAFGGYVYYRNTQVPPGERWELSFDGIRKAMEERQTKKIQGAATVHIMDKDDALQEVPGPENEAGMRAHQLLETLVQFAVPRGADLVEMAADAKRAKVNVRIDGVRYNPPGVQLDPPLALAFMDYVKGGARMDLADQRRKQSGTLRVNAGEVVGVHEFGITTLGSTTQRQISMTVDPKAQGSIPFNELGLLESQRNQLNELKKIKGKLVIIASPVNNGQTSTLYTLIGRHDPYTQSVWTMEDKVLVELEGVTHEEIPSELPADQVTNKIQSAFRRDPDVVMYARQLDPASAKVIARAAGDVRVYLGIPADDAFTALRIWCKLVGDVEVATRNMGAIVAQRLVRKLCPVCRAPYHPDAAAMKKLNLPADRVTTLYKASGKVLLQRNKEPAPCPDCMQLGYKGRTGVFEVMSFTDESRSLLAGKDLEKLKSYLRKQKMLWMQEAALAKVLEGVTDIKEITRAFAGMKDYSQETNPGGTAAGRSSTRTATAAATGITEG